MKRPARTRIGTRNLNRIILMSAWGFTLVISSFLFLFVGRWIDVRLHTEPACQRARKSSPKMGM